jgi:hypothetical protein
MAPKRPKFEESLGVDINCLQKQSSNTVPICLKIKEKEKVNEIQDTHSSHKLSAV